MSLTNSADLVHARASDGGVRRARSIGPAIKRVLEAVVVLVLFGAAMIAIMALDLAIWTPAFHR